jgi:hypothetical protein
MNGRIELEPTAAGRLAAVVASLNHQFTEKRSETGSGPVAPDLADYRAKLEPFVELEIVKARIDEVRQSSSAVVEARMQELTKKLYEIIRKLPDSYKL